MLPLLVLAAAVPVAGVLAAAARKPRTVRRERGILIHAPAEAILAHVTDFRRWAAWSPYEKLDPEMGRTFSGAPSGPGAVYAWEGRKAGAGRMEMLETGPSRVVIQLDFTRPLRTSNRTEFIAEREGGATRVTWAMSGDDPFISRVAGVFIDLDRLIGKDFEAGLAALKSLAEGEAAAGRALIRHPSTDTTTIDTRTQG
jgi:Polyketide cyclase / dehydrase and lipid transport